MTSQSPGVQVPPCRRRVRQSLLAVSGVLAALAIRPCARAAEFYEMVTVGNPGNHASVLSYGKVDQDYQIGKYEVTIQQYTDFLNAVAATGDPYGLYNSRMATDLNSAGILRTEDGGNFIYSVIDNAGNSANRPVTYVSWFDAARFANWMANGRPVHTTANSASTEDGAYTLTGTSGDAPMKNTVNQNTGQAPTFYIPTEDEWFKAAYFDPTLLDGLGGYYLYATQSNDTPGNVIGDASNQVNYIVQPPGDFSVTQDTLLSPAFNYLSDVGSFTDSASYYGTFDQNGNVWEFLDAAFDESRSLLLARGGGWTSYDNFLWSSFRLSVLSSDETSNGGFRLAAPIPEPATFFLAALGLLAACGNRRRRGVQMALLAFAVLGLGSARATVDYGMVGVGDAGNSAYEPTGYGAVGYNYQMGKYDVTIQQYTDFLNAVAASKDTDVGLYHSSMGTDLNVAGILRTDDGNSYIYSVIDNAGSSANRPVTYVSWLDAARFANWMSNGQPVGSPGAGTTENGAYNLALPISAVTRNAINPNTGAAPLFLIPTRDEWYKAAFYSPDYNGSGLPGYYKYAMQSDANPGNDIGGDPNQANLYVGTFATTGSNIFSDSENYLTDVGAYVNSASYYGTFDQNGNVYQWNEDGSSGTQRGLIGGFWFGGPSSAANTSMITQIVTYEGNDVGFRLAGPIPEPGSAALLGMGVAALLATRRSRRPR